MAEARKGIPYVWTTWITKLLSGDSECVWASWFKARFKYEKGADDRGFDLAAWTADHNAMVRELADEMRKDGWTVTVESENEFKLEGKAATLSGKPDIVARNKRVVRVVDCKTGKQRSSDWWQVLIYLFALPLVRHDLVPRGMKLDGLVCYKRNKEDLEPMVLTAPRRADIVRMLGVMGQEREPKKTPSSRECRYCNIGPADCDARVDAEPGKVGATHEF